MTPNSMTSAPDADFLTWSQTAGPAERSAALRKLLAAGGGHARLTLAAAGDLRAVLDDIDLPRARLAQADLTGAKLRRADLRGADLTKARLAGADLGGARLRAAGLARADLERAELAGADLTGADLSKARLAGALGEDARFERATLRFADLRGATCEQARFGRADLWGADLSGVDGARADFRRAVAKEASFERAQLAGADFRRADLTKANFRGANLTGADLRGARLAGADLRGAVLRNARLDGLDLTRAALEGVHLSGARLEGTRLDWHQLGPRLAEETDGNFDAARGGYLALERAFAALGDTVAASWAYRRRRRMQKRHAWRQAGLARAEGRWGAALRHTAAAAADQLVEWLCDYGESVWRVLAALLFLFAFFTAVYAVTGSVVRVVPTPDGEIRVRTSALTDCATFSLLAMTTSGMPGVDLQPRDPSVHFLTGLQAFAGIALTGLLGFVAGNRIRR